MTEPPHVRAALARADQDRIVYNLTGIENQYDALLRQLPGVTVRFAMKACPVDEVLACLADRGAGFDAASLGEILQALRTGVAAQNVHYGNTVKSDSEIVAAYRLGITTFATDCVEDVRAIARCAPGSRVFCRVATDGEGALWGLTGKSGTDVPATVLAVAQQHGLVPAGMSIHVGSQQMTVRAWRKALDQLAAILPDLGSRGIHLDHINLGGGIPALGYLDGDGNPLAPPLARMFAAVRVGMRKLRDVSHGSLQFVVEPGRHLVAEHGSIRAHVMRLTVRRQAWLYLSCGRFNGLYEGDQLQYRLEFPTRTGGDSVAAVVAGPTCDSDDAMGGTPVPVPADLASGDPVWIHSAGAYAVSYSTRFNGFDPLRCVTVRAERVRPIGSADWGTITALEAAAYSARGLSESRAVLQSRARSSPATSFVLDAGDRIRGYLLALPYPPFRFPDPSSAEDTVFQSPNLHLHDIVICDEFRGRGWAKRLLRHLTDTARSCRYERISLVAVGGTADFWSARGYLAYPRIALPAGYGPDAVYMSRMITDESQEAPCPGCANSAARSWPSPRSSASSASNTPPGPPASRPSLTAST